MCLIIIFSFLFFSCNNNSTLSEVNDQKENPTEQSKDNNKDKKDGDQPNSTIDEQCYWQIMKRDTLVAKLVQNGNTISGKLTFDNYQKDGSTGSVKGVIDGDIIKLWYVFQSEGMNSVSELWYKKQGDALLRAIGPVGVKGDTSYFTDKSAITYDPKQKLEKTNCAEVPAKYK